ncbi:MAG: group II intron reverse transcriptase/maturase [Polyangiaceae bacterium]|jgi:RNA-directed DNA polymerase|nr:group II intron reverse transcriptase/maturase [Polyangiaceae bacterium]
MTETSGSTSISLKFEQIANLARRAPKMVLTTLAHHIDMDWLKEAYRRTRKDGAVGVDEQTAAEYASDLETNLRSLLERAKSGTYRAPPVRRVHIPKGDGARTRPIGIPTFEDKILQRAVAMVLGAVYEQDFLESSYGFRPTRSAHDALNALRNQIMALKGGWLVEVDIVSFFDAMVHDHLRAFVRQRVRDGVLLRLIDKWLQAGVLEDGRVTHPASGSPQGGVVSPLLSNVYLHEVLDTWFEREVKPRLRGRAFLCRYADDAVLLFEREEDARRVMDVLPKRFGKYGLTLHPEKTRLVVFRRPPRWRSGGEAAREKVSGVDLLGFTLHWATSRNGNWVVKLRTATRSLSRVLKRIRAWCRQHRHRDVGWQWQRLAAKLRGHYGYFGVTGNLRALERFRYEVLCTWRKWLSRRSNRTRHGWRHAWSKLLERYPLPEPRIMRAFHTAPIIE